MVVSNPIRRESGREYALRVLRDNIVKMELKPGSMVTESELARELGVSRTPVREALMDLARVKIVEVLPQRGNRIAMIDYAMVDEARFMREALECAAVERLCEMEIGPALAALRENVELQEFYLASGAPQKLLEPDDEFHRMLFEMVGAPHVRSLMDSMSVHFDRVRMISLTTVNVEKIVTDHRALYEALAARDGELARSVMHRHLTRYQVDKAVIERQYAQYIVH